MQLKLSEVSRGHSSSYEQQSMSEGLNVTMFFFKEKMNSRCVESRKAQNDKENLNAKVKNSTQKKELFGQLKWDK